MWFSDECVPFTSAFNFVLHCMWLLLPLTTFLSPIGSARAAQDFTGYRLTQFDALDSQIGSRISTLSCDIQTISSRPYARKCVVMKLIEVNVEVIRTAISNNAGGILIILPTGGWDENLLTHWLRIESDLLKEGFQVPVYFLTETDEVENMYIELRELSHGIDKSSGPSLLDFIFSTGYRAYVDAPNAHPMRNVDLVNIEGKLAVSQYDVKRSTIILVAHYDAGGAIPSLAYGANSNAAGVAVLLEAARMLSQLTDPKNVPKHNIMFLLTGGGKFNYLGSKRWLEMMSEDTTGIALFDSIEQVVNLEGLGVNDENRLYLHVSRLPKEGTFGQRLLSALELASKLHPLSNLTASPTVQVVHKKINLNQYDLAWEHERFALYRLHTATLSAWSSSTSYQLRNSVLDGGPLWGPKIVSRGYWSPVLPTVVARNARVLTEALVRLIFDTDGAAPTSKEFPFVDPSWSTETSAGALLDLLTLGPRSTQLLSASSDRLGRKTLEGNGLIHSLERYLRAFLPEVRITRHYFAKKNPTAAEGNSKNPSKSVQYESGSVAAASMPTLSAAGRDPEIVFYTGVSPQKIIVYRLKSSVFDLVVACCVGAYLYGLHIVFEYLEVLLRSISVFLNAPGKRLKVA
ncbi:nicalin [Echinococcus multilocularis]|uniref:Nicalin n=1 Tax=Echinococcus multilocularis TaxID=6211 RepID=A0A068YE75_ECHMU|nr:nicalin [Echinococcus multilocularis]